MLTNLYSNASKGGLHKIGNLTRLLGRREHPMLGLFTWRLRIIFLDHLGLWCGALPKGMTVALALAAFDMWACRRVMALVIALVAYGIWAIPHHVPSGFAQVA